MSDDYKPRFSFEITAEQQKRADVLFDGYGLRKAVFTKILDDVLDLIEIHGGIIIGAIMAKGVADTIPCVKKAIKVGKVLNDDD